MIKRGFVCGVFDLFHAGHVLMLQDCAKQCGHLTVALNKAVHIDVKINPDKNLPIYSIEEREFTISRHDLLKLSSKSFSDNIFH